jgi:PepSY-associated TM region
MKNTISTENLSKKKDSKIVKKIKKNMYQWHRILGIISVIPVIFWTLSGIMHPFMAHFFKPEIAHDKLELKTIDTTQIKLSLQEVLVQHKIPEIKNFRLVDFNNASYYQIKNLQNKYQYFNTQDAKELENGDQKYATYLSRYFLQDSISKVSKIELLTEFTSQYKYINRYLPVYKLTFDREDAMEIYVETSSSKLATYNPKSRQIFIWIFDTFHNWTFMEAITNNQLRIILMLVLLSIIVFSALSGIVIYGFYWKKFKKATPSDSEGFLRRNHRKIGVIVSFVTLTFAFSGGYHVTQKWQPNNLPKMIYEPLISISDLPISTSKLNVDYKNLCNISVIAFKKNNYFRCSFFDAENDKKSTKYINSISNKNENIEMEYADFLALKFSKMLQNPDKSCCEMDDNPSTETHLELKSSSMLTEFDKREYGFVNKRLPVVKLEYNSPDQSTYYIETETSRLAAIVNNESRLEAYSFAILHKYLLMEWAGKGIRDLVTVLAAFGIFVVSVMGLILFLKKNKS